MKALADANGAENLPTQWIEVDKNESQRAPDGKRVEPQMKFL